MQTLQYYVDKILEKSSYKSVARSINSRKEILEELITITSDFNESATVTERLYSFIHKITPPCCAHCEDLAKFRSTSSGYSQTCGKKTCVHLAQQESIKRKGVHHFQTDKFKETSKKTMLEKYNSVNYFSSELGKAAIKKTMQEKYGADNPARVEIFKQKTKETNSANIRERYKQKLHTNNEELVDYRINGYVKLYCNDCQNYSSLSNTFFVLRNNSDEKCCRHCNPADSSSSQGEKELRNFVQNILPDTVFNDRSLGMELDIYSESKKVAFEFNGVYWHNELYKDSRYHLRKTELCNTHGIKLYHVWQDDWVHKRKIVESRIRAALGVYDNVVYARKTSIKILDSKTSSHFFNSNHLQGAVKGYFSVGLFYQDVLVCAIQIGKSRFKKNETELIRYASLLNHRIIGGIEKLLRFATDALKIEELFTYCDNSWGDGNFYSKKGFISIGNTPPNYWYVIDGIRKNRFNFQKHKLLKEGYDSSLSSHEIMLSKKIYRIYDCGSSKWKFSF
jgi:hypothetical protein